eukprot:CAMPEP_0168564428 /NCGR_PEP_ID=MMETSP0413-20121227/13244_1 /TAXON_ID=136452 /ORGANISM="Filamoeba nolandi, Strain NC-AS-23-1" /LENGTH=77 /DNA_ID=CAMNT_0008596107 /DNA_START=649 /DNA_END=882 /DNA_ORIENTATION=-
MEPGHTYFGPDSRGGAIRRRFHDSDIYSMNDLVKMINEVKNTNETEFLAPAFFNLHGIRDAHVVLMTKESLQSGEIL